MTTALLLAETGINEWMIIGCVVGAVGTGMYLLIDYFFKPQTKTESRLDRMRNQTMGEEDSSAKRKSISELLETASPKFSDALKPKTEKEINALQKKLNEAGWRTENATQILSTLKAFFGIGGFLMGGGIGAIINGFSLMAFVYAAVAGVLFMFLPEIGLMLMARSRKQKLFLGLPDALDLMVVCVEAGLGMDQALRRVAEEMVESHPIVAHEFQVCNYQLQYGSTRETVLNELGDRNGVEDLKTLSAVMIQVDKFGTSVGKALRVQSEAMRTRRRQIAEEKASKTAVQLIFPLVLFIFPGVFVVLVGPAAITMMDQMLPMMGQ
jgi:tight adherence protein C